MGEELAGSGGGTPNRRRPLSGDEAGFGNKAPIQRWQGGLRARPSAGRFLQFFNKNNTYLCIFWQKYSYFEAITYQLKAFKISLNELNRINKVQVL